MRSLTPSRRSGGASLLPTLLAATLVAGTFACTADTTPASSEPEQVRSSLTRNRNPVVSEPDQKTFVNDNTAFTFDLYRQIAKDNVGQNIVFSPHSISTALAMTYAGAGGKTESEMKAALHFSLPSDRLHTAFNWLDLELGKRQGADLALHVDNALFGDKASKFEAPFLDALALNYDAGMNVVDFRKAPEPARDLINRWVQKRTEDRIANLLPQGSIDDSTRLVLVNTIFMDAKWQTPFTKDATRPATFHGQRGDRQVDTMHATGSYAYARDEIAAYLELPYKGGDVSMDIVLPEAGQLEAVEKSLTVDGLASTFGKLAPTLVTIGLPKLKLAPDSVSLRAALQGLGMKTPFQGDADFSKMSSSEALHVSDVLHKAFVQIDEEGTVAAAATAVVNAGTAAPTDDPKPFSVDRPYLFVVRDRKSGEILFFARVLDVQQ